jgi:hypothetical protein
MKHVVLHDLGAERAGQIARAAFAAYQQRYARYEPRAVWQGQLAEIAFTVKGVSLHGTLEVGPSSIEMDLQVPLLLRPFKGKALEVIEREIREWIRKAKAGEV